MDLITYAMCKNYTNKKVSQSAGLHREIVNSLPSTGDNNTIYMVLDPNASSPDVYDEWLWVNGVYEHIGSTRVDLTDYYNKTQVDTALNGKANVATSLAGYGITDAYTKTEVDTALSTKQDSLTFDNVPTQDSNKPVKSGGIFSTMAVPKYDATNRREYFEGGAAFSGNIDSSPTAGSNNAVASGGTKTYVDNLTSFLSFTHFVQIPFTTSVLDSIKAAFENDTIPLDIYGITLGMVRGNAGSQRVIVIAQNQKLSTTQTRYAAIYFGAYTAPRFLQKQDGTDWTDVAL